MVAVIKNIFTLCWVGRLPPLGSTRGFLFNMNIRVGDKYRVLEVLEEGQKYWDECPNILGKQVCETFKNNADLCPGVYIDTPMGTKINLAFNLHQARHVATLVITKLKIPELLNG